MKVLAVLLVCFMITVASMLIILSSDNKPLPADTSIRYETDQYGNCFAFVNSMVNGAVTRQIILVPRCK